MKNIVVTIIGLIIISAPSQAQYINPQTKNNTIIVKGTAILKQIPDIISAKIDIKSESKEYSDCQNNLLMKMEGVKSSFMKQAINKDLIKIEEFSITEKVEYIDSRIVHNGFVGNISITIDTTYSPEISEKLLAALKSDSSSLNYNIGFKLSERQKAELRQKAITLAINDAKEKAALIAESLNIVLKRINSVTYLDDELPWDKDRDIIIESLDLMTGVIPSEVVIGTDSTPNIDFNPKEIGIIKTVRIEWVIDRDHNKN